MAEGVTIKVSGVAPGTSEERIKGFFEDKGENISVGTLSSLEDGTVVVELIGVTGTELEMLLAGNHKLSKHPIQLELVPPDMPVAEIKSDSVSSLIEVRGVSGFEKEDLELYFETPKAGGRKGSIKSCTIEPNGIARIEFENPEVVASVMSITNHCLFGTPLKLTYPSSSGQQASPSPSRIWLTEVPPILVNEIEYITLFLERAVGDELPFSLTQVNDTTLLLEFSEEVHLSEKELLQIADKIMKKQVKGVKLKPTLTMPASSSIVTGKAMSKTKSKLLVSTAEDIELEYLSLLLEKAMDMESDKDFTASFVESRNYIVSLEKMLSEPEVEDLIKQIETKSLKIQIKAKPIDSCQLLLSELPSIDMAHLELLLEKVIGQGKEFILKDLENRKALLTFKRSMPDEELTAIVGVITSTKVKGANIKVQKLELPYTEVPSSTSSPCKLRVSGICSIDLEHLGLLIERATKLECNSDFFLEQDDDSSLMTCKKQLSEKELESLIAALTKVEVKGARLNVEVWKGEVTNAPTVLLISNVPQNCELDHLGLVLEKSLHMDLEEHFILSAHDDLSALATFKSSLSSQDLNEVIGKINKTVLKGNNLKATVFNIKELTTSSEEASSLLLEGIPDNADEDYLVMMLSKAMGIDENEFSVKCLDSCAALLTFKKSLADSALQDKIYKIGMKQVKGKSIKAVSWKTTPCIYIRNITEHYDEEFLKHYLENTKRSGGGEVVSVELFGNGEAKVMFKDLKVMRNVIQMQHRESLGNDVTVTQDNPLEKFSGSKPVTTLQNVQIKVLPDIVGALQREQANWNRLLSNLHVNTSVDVQQAVITITPSKYTPAGWIKCESVVKKYIDSNFATKDLPFSQAAALDIIKLLQSRYKDIIYSISENNTTLHLVAHPNLLVQIENQVHEIMASVAMIEKLLTLDPEDFAYIAQIKQQEISELAPDTKIVFTAPNKISLNGTARDVKKLEENIVKLSVHSSVTMVMDPLLKEFACTNDGREQIRSCICISQGISAAICIKGSGSACTVVVLCDPEIVENVKKAVSNAQKELHIEILPMSSKCHAKISEQNTSKDYNDICDQLQKKHGVTVKRASDCICIAGFKDKVSQTHSALNEFIQIKCKVTKSIKIEDGMWKLFQTHMKSAWDALSIGIKGTTISTRSEKNSTTITVCGQIDIVDEMYEELIVLQKKVLKKDVYPPLHTTGFSEYKKSSEWTVCLTGTESLCKVSIAILNSKGFTESDLIPAVVADIKDSNNTIMSKNDTSVPCTSLPQPQSMVWTSSNLKCVKIHKGSLLDIKADVYVNSTNANLDLSGGVISKILAEAAGPSLQDECTRKAPINPGQITITGSGNIKCKYIFHIALNTYDGPGGIAEKVLKESMDNCLNECKKQNIASIAFPALGTGVLNFPPQVAAKVMMESVATVKDLTGIKVHFIIFLDAVQKAFDEMLAFVDKATSNPFETESTIAAQPPAPQLQRHISSIMHKRSPRKLDASSYLSSLKPMLSSNKFSFDNVTVEIVRGDLTDQNSDVIVNSTSSDMKSASGVSGAILKKGGLELTKACEAYIAQRNQLDIGKVAITPTCGGLKCKCVFHVNVDPAQLQLAVSTCLKEADGLNYQSISFPALATGNHKSSADRVANEMYKAFHLYALQKPQHTTQISVVIFQSELLDPFLKAFQHLCSLEPTLSSDDGIAEDTSITYTSISNPDDVTSTRHNTASFWFRIFGADESAVKKAAAVLDEHLSKTFVCESIDNIIVKPSADVLQLCNAEYVTLTHDATTNTITLSGRKCGVDIVRRRVESDKNEQEKLISLKREAELVHKQVQWQHQVSDKSYVSYTAEVNILIEKAYQEKKKKYDHNDSTDPFSIDFSTLIETKPNSKSPPGLVKREDLLAHYHEDIPKTWEKMPIDAKTNTQCIYHLCDLKNTSQEFIGVQQRFALTMNATKIIKIQRVQNAMLYGQYIARKNAMEKINPTGTKIENLLFHGTSADTIPKINSQGFNRSFAGKNATAYGRGVYFAVDANYSAQATYSPPDASGYKYMYLVRVLTGEFTVGNSLMIVPPAKNPTVDQNVLFDSLVDRAPNPSMYIIFQDAQAYPEYLITF